MHARLASALKPLSHLVSMQGAAPHTAPAALMTSAMSLHFFGYECARAASLSMLRTGGNVFGDDAVALMQGMAAPVASVMLLLYGFLLGRIGPRRTLGTFAGVTAAALAGLAGASAALDKGPMQSVCIAALFLVREGYVHLLATQYWAFLNSVMPKEAAAKWFPRIAGVTCAVSALAGVCISPLSNALGGVHGLVMCTAALLVVATFCSDRAYARAPVEVEEDIRAARRRSQARAEAAREAAGKGGAGAGVLERILPAAFAPAWALFARSRVLRALLSETVVCQALSAMLSLAFHAATRESMGTPEAHAAFVGQFYAGVNVASSTLQFLVLPWLLSRLTKKESAGPARLLLVGPALVGGLLVACAQQPSLTLIALCFGAQKVIEYSVRSSATEMLYVPLGYEEKFLGKEVISVLGTRGGRSASSLAIAQLSKACPPASAGFAAMMAGVAVLWGGAAAMAQPPAGKDEAAAKKNA